MMDTTGIKRILDDCCNDLSFMVSESHCGVMPQVSNSKKEYLLWCGDNETICEDSETAMKKRWFMGMNLFELLGEGVEITVS